MSPHDPETITVRADETLPLERLLPWLKERLPEFSDGATIRQFGGGKANLTYLLASGAGQEYVLRRPPLGPIAATAHDIAREHRVLSNLWRIYPLAPQSLYLCQDPSIIGADFHILERRHGIVIRREDEANLLGNRNLASRIATMLVDALADLHMADADAAGLGDMGRPDGFMERQVQGWTKRWYDALAPDAPDADELIRWIVDNRPATRRTGLVHNDYKLDNVLVSPADPATATAVLDWDMCTRGDVLSDLGTLLNYCVSKDDSGDFQFAMGRSPDTPGFPSRSTMTERYIERTAFDLGDIAWYRTFAAFRTAVILQQIYIRWLRGQTEDSRFQGFGHRVAALVSVAKSIRV